MNDRLVSLLENYEMEVLRTWKGRGAILCETGQGIAILKEYAGHEDKCAYQEEVLRMIQSQGFFHVETIIRNKEGGLLTADLDGTRYILKTYFEGRECNVRDSGECALAMASLAKLHKATKNGEARPFPGKPFCAGDEFEKHNRELRKVKKFLREKSQKTDFELYLIQCYEYYLQLAIRVAMQYHEYGGEQKEESPHVICHGDYQHHNLLMTGNTLNMINFEKCGPSGPVRDIYLFMRKLLEKSDWSAAVGFGLLNAYEKENRLEKEDYAQLYYRLAYPEKFWKIANFYYNSGKAFIPGKNLEKLMKVDRQEKEKNEFLTTYRKKYGILVEMG